MKFSKLLIIIPMLAAIISCENDSIEPVKDLSSYFKVEVLGRGMDCGDTYIVEFKEKIDEIYEIVGRSYSPIMYANDLPETYKKQGLVLYIKLRVPASDEMHYCTAMGPAYGHIHVTDVEFE